VNRIELISLFSAACAAGAVNAIAGGGTLITFPVLILFGSRPWSPMPRAPSRSSSASSGILRIPQADRGDPPVVPSFLPVSLLGGWIGSFLLTHGKSETFSRLVPYLILFATVLFMLQGAIRRLVARRAADELIAGHDDPPTFGIGLLAAVFFQFLVSV